MKSHPNILKKSILVLEQKVRNDNDPIKYFVDNVIHGLSWNLFLGLQQKQSYILFC